MNDLGDLGGMMKELQQAIARARLENPAGPVDEQLGQLSGELDAAFAAVQRDYPRTLASYDQQIAEVQREAEATLEEITAKRQELAERLAAQAAAEAVPPPVPDLPFDPELGGQLRDEILKLFVESSGPDASKPSHGSLWSVLRRGG